jgi:Holliday junction resolvase RusA-like endonuclease
MRAEFTIPGAPQGKGRPRFSSYGGRVHTRTPEQTVLYENLVRTEYQRQCGETRFPDGKALHVEIRAYFEIPKSVSKKKRAAMIAGLEQPVKKPDLDNIAKCVLDSLNGIAYRDDSQVAELLISKFYGETPRVKVWISGEEDLT